MNIDVMIDIETMGTGTDAPVLSIGAVAFNIRTGEIIKEFYTCISLESAMYFGKADPSTIRFWMKQPTEVRKEICKTSHEGAEPLEAALDSLLRWFPRTFGGVWANGCSFDLVILETMFKRTKTQCPWKFWEHRCCRTIKDLGKIMKILPAPRNEGGQHNALEDAKAQVIDVVAVTKKLAR